MCKGGGGSSNTVTQTQQPNPAFQAAYTNAVQTAQGLAAKPYQQYPGNLQAPLSPDQQSAIGNIQSAQGVSAPYINTAADYYNNATTPLAPGLDPFFGAQNADIGMEQQIANGVGGYLQNSFNGANNSSNAINTVAQSAYPALQNYLGQSNQDVGGMQNVADAVQPALQNYFGQSNQDVGGMRNVADAVQPALQNYFGLSNNAIGSMYGTAGNIPGMLQGYGNQSNQNVAAMQQAAAGIPGGLQGAFGQANQDVGGMRGIAGVAPDTIGQFQQIGSPQINQYLNPYTDKVVGATQAEFNNQNRQQANQLSGSAVQQGAFGGDREAIAQGTLANQQQLAQAPVIAGLESQGYQQAVSTAQQQQQAQLANQQAQLSSLGLAGGLYGQAAQNALQQGSLGLQGQTAQAGIYGQAAQNALQQAGLGLQGGALQGQLYQNAAQNALQQAGIGLQGQQLQGSLYGQAAQNALQQGSLGLQGQQLQGSLYGQAAQNALQQAGLSNQTLGMEGQLYGQTMQGALQQGALGVQGSQAAGGLYQNAANAAAQQGQMQLGANEQTAWLNNQAAAGMAGLGNQALGNTLTGANALMGAGGLEQQQAQQSLNIPYQQWLAAQSWPYQTTGWEANIAEGLGSAAGGTSATQYPAPSVGSQIAGAGLTGLGALGMTGAFGNSGYLTGASGLFGGGATAAAPLADLSGGAFSSGLYARGGTIPHRAGGGGFGMPGDSRVTLPHGIPGVPDVSVSIIPEGTAGRGQSGMVSSLANPGTTSTTSGGGGGGGSGILGALGGIASIARLGLSLNRGGHIPGRASGGSAPVSVTIKPGSYAGSPGVPQLNVDRSGADGGAALNNYLGNTAASANPPPPPPAAAPPAAAPAAQAPTPGGPFGTPFSMLPPGGPPQTSPGPTAPSMNYTPLTQANAAGVPGIDPAAGAGAGYMGPNPTADGWLPNLNLARGGMVGLADGGFPTEFDDYGRPIDTPEVKVIREPAKPQGLTDDRPRALPPDEMLAATPPTPPTPLTVGQPEPGSQGAPAGMDLPLPPMPPQQAGMNLPVPPMPPQQGPPQRTGMGLPPPPQAPAGATGPMGPMGGAAPMGGQPMGGQPGGMLAGRGIPPPVQPRRPSSGDPWEALMYAGLGTMGGRSPHALTNIGQGALQGLQMESQQRHLRESEQQAAERLANEAEYHRQQLIMEDKREQRYETWNQERQRQFDAMQGIRGRTADRLDARTDLAFGNAFDRRQHQGVIEGQGQQRLDDQAAYRQQLVDSRQQRLAQIDRSLDLKAQHEGWAKDSAERKAEENQLKTASSDTIRIYSAGLLAGKNISVDQAKAAALKLRRGIQNEIGPEPSVAPSGAPQGAPSLQSIFDQ